MKKIILFLLFFGFSGKVLASSAESVVETQVESSGESQIYQSVETTVNGQTIKKESSQPGKLELKMEKADEGKPTVSFITPVSTPTETPIGSFFSQIIEFFHRLFSRLKLDNLL